MPVRLGPRQRGLDVIWWKTCRYMVEDLSILTVEKSLAVGF